MGVVLYVVKLLFVGNDCYWFNSVCVLWLWVFLCVTYCLGVFVACATVFVGAFGCVFFIYIHTVLGRGLS